MSDPGNEAPRRRRTLWALGLVAAGIAAAAITWWVRREPPATVPIAAPTPHPGPPLFAHWVRHETFDEPLRSAMASHYVDTLLGHQVFRIPPSGLPPMLARALLLDDDDLLLPSGRRLWNREMAYQPGLAGTFCFIHSSYCLKRLFDVSFSVDGVPAVIYDNQYAIERFPSHTTVRYGLGAVAIDEHRFITYDDRAVAAYRLQARDGGEHEVTLEIVAPYPPVPQSDGAPGFPLLGRGKLHGMPIFLYLDAPGFTRLPSDRIHLQRRLTLPAGETVHAAVAYRFDDTERESPAAPLGDAPLDAHIREYNRWFAENVPYFDAPDPDFKKMWYYRWWIVRFHLTEPGTADLQGFAFYEGKLGFDNLIGFAVPAQLKELTYLRDPKYGLSQVENSYRNRSREGAVLDAPGSPYWGETYSHWIAQALAEFHRVHPLPPETLRALLPAMASDVRAWLGVYDRDGDALPERRRPRVTGYDLDILSWWHFNDTKVDPTAEPPALERVDFASFVFANAWAVSELAEEVGDAALAAEFSTIADRIRSATLEHLWDEQTSFFYPRQADTHERIPIRELHGFFPFTTLLAPNQPRYVAALRLFVDPDEFWARYPPVITSTHHYRRWTWEMDGLTRNIAPHPISMGARTLLQALKHYDQTAVSADHFMELMARYNDLVYPRVHPNDTTWRPNVHEYYSQWEPYRLSSRPKPSDISHDFHSMYCSLIVEGVVGLTPRSDAKIELQPLAQRWEYFLLDGLRYRGRDLTVVWNRPGGERRYPHYPEGLSLAIDGRVVFTRPTLERVVYDPASDGVE
jgi:hypothetical protein